MKRIIRLTERDITRIINKVLKEETSSNDTPVMISKTSNISEVRVCVGSAEKMKCTNHKVEVCFKRICSKVKIKDTYISIFDGLEAEIKPSEDSGFFIKNSFKTLLYPWINSDGYLEIESGWDVIKKPLDKMINGYYPININVGHGVTVKIK
jgi:hypothetical protein